MTGALFRNTRKNEDSDQPEYHGDLVVAGIKYRLAGWHLDVSARLRQRSSKRIRVVKGNRPA